jgi:hypothetical protein
MQDAVNKAGQPGQKGGQRVRRPHPKKKYCPYENRKQHQNAGGDQFCGI